MGVFNKNKNEKEKEGKTFDKDTVFQCDTDCWQDGSYYSRGDLVTGRKCPPHFVVTDIDPKTLEEKKE